MTRRICTAKKASFQCFLSLYINLTLGHFAGYTGHTGTSGYSDNGVEALRALDRGLSSQLQMPHQLHQQSCSKHNLPLKSWLQKQLIQRTKLLPDAATSLEEFVLEVKASLDAHQLPVRVIEVLFNDNAEFHPTCSGLWMKFGVFEGLSEDRGLSSEGTLNLQDSLPPVNSNVNLVKGLFSNTLPGFLREHGKYAGEEAVIRSIIVFDELVNYPGFKEQEIKAFFEYLVENRVKVLPVGIHGPLPYRTDAVSEDGDGQFGPSYQQFQSAAFVVAEINVKPNHACTRSRKSKFCTA